MTLPASGEITLNDVNVELGNTGTDAITIGSADVRDLFGVASGEITMADGYGKSSVYEIANSCRFNDNDSAYLSRTSSASNRKTWTWSGWVKRGNTLSEQVIFGGGTSGTNNGLIRFNSDDTLRFHNYAGGFQWNLVTTAFYRDTASWYNIIAVADTSNGTSGDRVRLYVNGQRITAFGTETYPSQNYDGLINSSIGHTLARYPGASSYQDGYQADVHFIDGTALTPSSFGETGDYGEWKPIEYSGSYGTNGFHLDFASSGTLGNDANGSNNWTTNNLASTDQMIDTPTNNFCTLNPLHKGSSAILSEGNLKIMTSAYFATGTHTRLTGKWYFEQLIQSSNGGFVGVTDVTADQYGGNHLYDGGQNTDGWGYYKSGSKLRNSSYQSYGSSFTTGDIIGCAFDLDNSKIYFSKNGTWQNSGNPVTGANPAYTDVNKLVSPRVGHYNSNSPDYANFGQDSSFAGNKTAQGNQDSNSIGDFYYTPPSGFKALCTANLPDPAVIPNKHFDAQIYTGSHSSDQDVTSPTITGVDLVWLKSRSNPTNHALFDRLRGTKELKSDTTAAEVEGSSRAFGSLLSNGVELLGTNDGGNINQNPRTYVAWMWKAGGTGVSNTNGSITSTVSANQDAGFSILTWTGNGSQNSTVGHGLSKAPEMVIIKPRNESRHWLIWHEAYDDNDKAMLFNTDAPADNRFGPNAPTSTVFGLYGGQGNRNGTTFVGYAFHSVDGYSKVGSYKGNGSTDGTFVYTGFRPAYVMVKCASNSGQSWLIYDTKIHPDNVVDSTLRANQAYGTDTHSDYKLDLLSNGFKTRSTWSGINSSGSNYIYIAFAEQPFKYTNAR